MFSEFSSFRRNLATYCQVLLAVSFVIFGYVINSGALQQFDLCVTSASQSFGVVVLDYAMALITYLGSVEMTCLIGFTLAVLFWKKGDRRVSFLIVAIMGMSAAIEFLYKSTIYQPRVWPEFDRNPFSLHIIHLRTRFIFPSGHAIRALFIYGFIALLAWRSGRIKLAIASVTTVLVIGFSRVYLGDHWSTDVIGGFLLGALALSILFEQYSNAAPNRIQDSKSQAPNTK